MRLLGVLLGLAVTACSPATPASPLTIASPSLGTAAVVATPATPSGTEALRAALRRGGVYIVMRHGAVDPNSNEAQTIDLDDCRTQASLAEPAKRDLQKMSGDIAALGITVGTVWASPYCRTLETARIVFGRATPNSLLLRGAYAPAPGKPAPTPAQQRLADLQRLLATPTTPNVVLVTHGDIVRSALGIEVAEGESSLVQPTGTTFSVIGRITVLGWSSP